MSSYANSGKRPPVSHANRGKAFESAVSESCLIYRRRGLAYITQHRAPSRVVVGRDSLPRRIGFAGPVDFTGVAQGIPVAFDAKSTGEPRLDQHMIAQHQLEELLGWQRAGGVGFLLVEIQRKWLVAVTAELYLVLLGKRGSVPMRAFADEIAKRTPGIAAVTSCSHGVPVDFLAALPMLRTNAGRSE